MDGFFDSFTPILQRLKNYAIEIVLIILALAITLCALIIYFQNNQDSLKASQTISISKKEPVTIKDISIDVSGSVKKPGLYKIAFGARLKDVIDMAGGLSDEADTTFFKMNFNLARIISDQEKIYVPSISEIANGIFAGPLVSDNNQSDDKISLNTATVDELDHLPGVGQITANKIITNRPYKSVDDILSKKIVSKPLYDNLSKLIKL